MGLIERASNDSRGSRVGRWLLALAMAGSALAVGTVHPTTLCIVTVALAAAVALTWWNAEPTGSRAPATILLFSGIALTGYTALQCVPIRIRWLSAIAPHNADVWSRALAPLHESWPRWAPLSVDPTATRLEVLKGAAYLLALVAALRVARRREGVMFLSRVLVLTGVALALAALLHPAFGAHKLYGAWEPSGDYGRHLAPLLNPNNLASYLNIALLLALAGAMAPEPHWPRPILAALVLLLAGTQVWVASRGGVAAMLVGGVLVVGIVRTGRARGQSQIGSLSLLAGVVLVASAFMIVLGGSEDASDEFLQADASKLGMFRETMRMVPAYPIFGAGRGAFETAFPAFRSTPGNVTFVYPENVVAQWITEWGFPVGVVGLAAITYALRPDAVLARSNTAAGAWAAVVALTVQNLVDLGSEIPGLVVAGVVCAAIVTGGTAGRGARWRVQRWARAPRAVALAGLALGASAVAFAVPSVGARVSDDRVALHHAVMQQRLPHGSIQALARSAMQRHPGEPYLPFIMGVRALEVRDDDPVPWIGAALERAPTYGLAHIVLARALDRRSPSQARLEYRLAVEQAPELSWLVMAEAPRAVRTYNDAMELVPHGPPALQVLEALSGALRSRLPATSVRIDSEISSRAPQATAPALRAARAAVEDVLPEAETPWCELARGACVRQALDASRRATQLAPNQCAPSVLYARARAAAGDPGGAQRELSEAADRAVDRVVCLQEVVELATMAHDERRALEAMDEIVNAGCTNDGECGGNLALAAQLEESRGNHQHALALYKRAYERSPEDDGLLGTMARLASGAGLHAEASEDYEKLARRHPTEAQWRKAADYERMEATKAVVIP